MDCGGRETNVMSLGESRALRGPTLSLPSWGRGKKRNAHETRCTAHHTEQFNLLTRSIFLLYAERLFLFVALAWMSQIVAKIGIGASINVLKCSHIPCRVDVQDISTLQPLKMICTSRCDPGGFLALLRGTADGCGAYDTAGCPTPRQSILSESETYDARDKLITKSKILIRLEIQVARHVMIRR